MHKKRLWTALQSKLNLKKQKLENLGKRLIDPRRRLQDLIIRCDELSQRLEYSIKRYVEYLSTQISMVRHRLGDPNERIKKIKQQLEYIQNKMNSQMRYYLEKRKSELSKNMVLLDSLSPLKVVERGYSIVTIDKKIVKNINQLQVEDKVRLKFAIGEAEARIEKLIENK